MDKNHLYFSEILKASRRNRLVFFVGAGISRISGYPSWFELIKEFSIDLYGDNKDNYCWDEYLRIPQLFYDVKGKDRYDEILSSFFTGNKEVNLIHDQILSLNPIHLLTTNYDNLLEQSCWKRGKYFSLIQREDDVSETISSSYIIKVHGGFSKKIDSNKIVLKENDYLNYDNNFPLISNLVKTILSTYVVIFIGYSLADYNIKLLMNWVQSLQKETFARHFLIWTEKERMDLLYKNYFEKKGIRIIDACDFYDGADIDNNYQPLYSAVLNSIIEFRENYHLEKITEIIDYLYQKFQPLFGIRIRVVDLTIVLNSDYQFLVYGQAIPNPILKNNYLKTFLCANIDEIKKLSNVSQKKYLQILDFLHEYKVYIDDSDNRETEYLYPIKNLAFHSEYIKIKIKTKKEYKAYKALYEKAFYLFSIGEWESSYKLYTYLIMKTNKSQTLLLYYLSQINRYWLQKYILGYLHLHRGLFSPEFVQSISTEYKNVKIDDIFTEMPFEFQEKYEIFKMLCDLRLLYTETVNLFKYSSEVHSQINRNSNSFGFTAATKISFDLETNIQFLYENKLICVNDNIVNNYINSAMTTLLEKASHDIKRNQSDDDFWHETSDFTINYNDFIYMSKSMDLKDIEILERKFDLGLINFVDNKQIQKYVINNCNIYLLNEKNSSIFYRFIEKEVKTSIFLSRYIKFSSSNLEKIINTILNCLPNILINDKYRFITRLLENNKFNKNHIALLKNFFEKEIPNAEYMKFRSAYNLPDFMRLIIYFDKEFVSQQVSKLVLEISTNEQERINFLFQFKPIMNNVAKKRIDCMVNVDDLDTLIDYFRLDLIDDFAIYERIILDYLEAMKARTTQSSNKIRARTIPINDHMLIIGIWYFIGKIHGEQYEKYLGLNDKFDFFISPETFISEKFQLIWLYSFTDIVMKKVSQNKAMRRIIVNSIKTNGQNINDTKFHHRMEKYFLK